LDLESALDSEQSAAVRAVSGPVLVLAGAGSGKTRVLTYRVAHLLIHHQVSQVLAVTFTRKAAQEMCTRVEALMEGMPLRGWIGTFHALCARILRRESSAIGYSPDFVIYDEDDQRRLLKSLHEDLGISERILSVAGARSEISAAKSVLLDPDGFGGPGGPGASRPVAEVYRAYQEALHKNHAMDFDDLLRLTVGLFDAHPDVLDRYRRVYPYVLVDEYQDTNHAQYRLVAQLAAGHRNLCVVGDDDQSIYSWRGADVNNILDFEKEFPEAKVIHLERNYRSTARILAGAQGLVSKNRRRKPKTLWTPNDEGDRIRFRLCENERAEAEAVVGDIRGGLTAGVSARDMAVLYRTNAQSRALEDALRRAALPYVLIGSTRFYDRREVRDILAYLKVIVNPADGVSLLRILNVPPRGVGRATLGRLIRISEERGQRLLETLASDRVEGVRPGVWSALSLLANDLGDWNEAAKTKNAGEIVADLVERIQYLEYLKTSGASSDGTAESRVENVEELVAAAKDFSLRVDVPTLVEFLGEISLSAPIDLWDEGPEAVNLMTLHNAKGLEFRWVLITGLEEGLLPHITCLNSRDPLEVEEERRLMYVGLTRAREKVHLFAAERRMRYQGPRTVEVSRFVSEIPSDLLDGGPAPAPAEEPEWEDEPPDDPGEGFSQDGCLSPGTYVRHPDFGPGRVVAVEGAGESLKVTVQFDAGFRKRILVRYGHLSLDHS